MTHNFSDFSNIHPKTEPERAQELLDCPNPQGLDKQRQFILRMYSRKNPCPRCEKPCSYYEASDTDVAIEDPSSDSCHCPNCGVGLMRILPLAGLGWYWTVRGHADPA